MRTPELNHVGRNRHGSQAGITHLIPLEAHVAQLLDQPVQPVLRSTDNSTVRQERRPHIQSGARPVAPGTSARISHSVVGNI
jgi:hypothetical protein